MTGIFTDNTNKSRFEYSLNGSMAFANYRRAGTTLYIDYVEAPPALRGTGAAGTLMQQIVELARKENLTIVPICGYAAAWLSKHG
ncbi:MAG: N-acetyltransferase [Proteobacteria bacterium]|nr:N-acetyltransferase [Pseudomonadota bacterium]